MSGNVPKPLLDSAIQLQSDSLWRTDCDESATGAAGVVERLDEFAPRLVDPALPAGEVCASLSDAKQTLTLHMQDAILSQHL